MSLTNRWMRRATTQARPHRSVLSNHSLAAILFLVLMASHIAACGGEVDFEETDVEEATSELHLDAWKSVGPSVMLQGQIVNGPVQGRMSVVVANPANPRIVYVGSATGGAWQGRLTDPGPGPTFAPKWTALTDRAPSLAVGAIALDSCDINRCNTIWVGTGENRIRRDTQYGRGLMKLTWNIGTSKYDLSGPFCEAQFARGSITKIVRDPVVSGQVFMTLSSGVTSNATHATVTTEPVGPYGVWKYNGTNCTNVFSTGTPATDLELDHLNGSPFTLFAGFRDAGVYRSTNGGTNWESLHGGQMLPTDVGLRSVWPEIAARPQTNGNTALYAVLGDCWHPHAGWFNGQGHNSRCRPGVWLSKNASKAINQVKFDHSWSDMLEPPNEGNPSFEQNLPPLSTYASYTHALTIHPTNVNQMWYGGVVLYRGTVQQQMGQNVLSFTTMGGGTFPLHPDVHDMYVWAGDCTWAGCASTNLCAYVLTDGGFAVGDGQNCWNPNFNSGLEVMQFHTASVASQLVGGTQDNGTGARLFGSTWYHWNHGDASSTIIDKSLYATQGPFLWSVDWKGGDAPRACNMSNACALHTDFPREGGINAEHPLIWYPPIEQYEASPFSTRFFGGQRVYKNTTVLGSWADMMQSPPAIPLALHPDVNSAMDFPSPPLINVITAIGVAQADANRLYVGYYDGTVFTTANATNANPSWTRIDENAIALPNRPITAIAVHPTNASQAYVSVSGFGTNSVFLTQFAGSSWQLFDTSADANNEFATRPVNALVVVPTTPPVMFAGTDEGVYRRATANPGMDLWTKSTSLPNVAVYDFAVDASSNDVYAATHGRGVWRLWAAHFIASADLFKALASAIENFSGSFSAHGFDPFRPCSLTLVAQSGTDCVTSTTDADGAQLNTNEWGYLVGTKSGAYIDRPMGWACYNGSCAGGITASDCPLGSIRVTCGTTTGTWNAPVITELTDPASTQLAFAPMFSGGATSGSFVLKPTMQHANGTSEQLCSVSVPFLSSDTVRAVLDNAAAAVNGNTTCQTAGVSAIVTGEDLPKPGIPHRLHLSAPSRTGLELLTVIDGSLYAQLGVETMGWPVGMPVTPRFVLSGAASGGSITVTALSAIGTCRVSVTTSAGESAATVITRLRDAFSTPSVSSPWCLATQNARDAVIGPGSSLRFVASGAMTVHNTDPGLSFSLSGDS